MSCIKDVQKAINEQIFKDYVDGKPTYRRSEDGDGFEITQSARNKSKGSASSQAFNIAKETLKRIAQEYNGHVSGYISQESSGAWKVNLRTNPDYIDHVYNSQLEASKRTEIHQSPLFSITPSDQDKVNANAGSDNIAGLDPTDEYANPSVGYYTKFIQHKENILNDYQRRLGIAQKESNAKGVTSERLKELNTIKRHLTNEIYGVRDIGKEGIKDEILRLKKKANEISVGYYVEKDLSRIAQLSSSDNLDEINEANKLIDFYSKAGTFVFPGKEWANPFFNDTDVYITDDKGNLTNQYAISDEDRKTFTDWAERAMNYRIITDKKMREIAERAVNNNTSVQKTYGDRKFTILELTTGLKDVHWVDAWTMHTTNNIFNRDSLIPQIMFSHLQTSVFKRTGEAVHFKDKIEGMNDAVLKELKRIGSTMKKAGIDGFDQGVYTPFLEKNENGQLTGGYAYKFNPSWRNERGSIDNGFSKSLDEAYLNSDYDKRNKLIKRAFQSKNAWYRKNTHILEFNKVPEIVNNPEFGEFENHYDRAGADAYKQSMINKIGAKEYNNQVEEQSRLLRKYTADRNDLIDTLKEEQGIGQDEELSKANLYALDRWRIKNSPFAGINNYYETNFDKNGEAGNYSGYNVFIPRRTEANISLSEDKQNYVVRDTSKPLESNFYNKDFEDNVENNPTLYEFHKVLKESADYIKSVAPPDIANKMQVNHLPTLDKTSAEVVTNNYSQANILMRIIPGFKNMWESIRKSFGINKQSEVSFAQIDPATGKANYKINDGFLRDNKRAIENSNTIERAKFLQAFNTDNKEKISNLGFYTKIPLKDFNPQSLVLLSNYLGMDLSLNDAMKGNISSLKSRVGDDVQLAKVINDYSTHEAVKNQSFDLAKLVKHFTLQAAYYSARSEALPVLNLMKNYYDNIAKTKENNVGKTIFNIPNGKLEANGVRTLAIKRSDENFERVVLGNTTKTAHKGVIGSEKISFKHQEEIAEIGRQLHGNIAQEERDKLEARRDKLIAKDKIPTFGKTIYSKEDKQKFVEIEKLLSGDNTSSKEVLDKIKELNTKIGEEPANKALVDEKIALSQRYELLKIQEGLGKTRTATAVYDNIMNWITHQRLGWNVNSAISNMFEGYYNNMLLAATGEYFTPKNVYTAYGMIKHSFVKNATFGLAETNTARKIRIFMDKHDVLTDHANETQKPSQKTYSNKFEWLKSMALTKRVEYVNQGVVMISHLLDQKVKSIDGTKEVNLFDATDKDGKLLPEFRTEENINNWENLQGDKYLEYKKNLSNTIRLGHGNYDVLRGMMAKSTTAGKALMMFKTWLPEQLYWRFATEQDDIASSTIGYKGKYWSYGPGTGALHGATVGLAAAGPIGALIGGGAGAIFGAYANHKYQRDTVNVFQETLFSTLMLAKKMFGMPINSITGRRIINDERAIKLGSKEYGFDNFVGKGGFTRQDANALKSNMGDIAMQLTMIAMLLFTKSMFWDDDDKADSEKRKIHNLLVNKIMQQASQAGGYVNITSKDAALQSTVGSVAVLGYLNELQKTAVDASMALTGNDEIQSGQNAGQSRLANQLVSTFVPGGLKSPLSAGFQTMEQRQFQTSPFDNYFKLHIQQKRKELKTQLQTDGTLSKAEIEREVNKQFPTKARLKKNNMTREEWKTTYGQ